MVCLVGQALVWISRETLHRVPCGQLWPTGIGNRRPSGGPFGVMEGLMTATKMSAQPVLEVLFSDLVMVYECLSQGLGLCGSLEDSGICYPDCCYKKRVNIL